MTYAEVVPMFASARPHRELRNAMDAVLADGACRGADFLKLDLTADSGPWPFLRLAASHDAESSRDGTPQHPPGSPRSGGPAPSLHPAGAPARIRPGTGGSEGRCSIQLS
jgi:hypothetical protein